MLSHHVKYVHKAHQIVILSTSVKIIEVQDIVLGFIFDHACHKKKQSGSVIVNILDMLGKK